VPHENGIYPESFRPSAGEKLQVINEIELEAGDTRNLSSARFAEELGIMTLHLVYKAATDQEFALEFPGSTNP
jgi:hypothetical protein